MGLLIRKASLTDAAAIHAAHMKSIQEVCYQDHTPEEIKVWGHRPYNEAQRHSAIKNDSVWVVEDHGQIEGYGHFKLYEKEAKDKKIKEITLEATLTAHEFYKKMGFSDSGPQTSVEISGQKIRCYPMKMTIL